MSLLKDAITLLKKKNGGPVKEGAVLSKAYRLNENSTPGAPDSRTLDNTAAGAPNSKEFGDGDVNFDGDHVPDEHEIPRNDGPTSGEEDLDHAIKVLQDVVKSLSSFRDSEAAEDHGPGGPDEEMHVLTIEQERDMVEAVIKILERAKSKVASKPMGEKWEHRVEIKPNKKDMFKGKSKSELQSELKRLKDSGPHKKGTPEYTKTREIIFALRAKSGWDKKVNETLSASASAGKWIDDFVHSKNKKFKGKSKAKRREMALGAYYANKGK